MMWLSTANCGRSGFATSRSRSMSSLPSARIEQPWPCGAPFAGVVTVTVHEGDQVEAGPPVATIEAMKMEASITAPVAGVVQRLAIPSVQQVEGGDLLLVIAL